METRAVRKVPASVRQMRLGERMRWARKSFPLSHDRLVERMGRSNRGHLIKIEQGTHIPGIEFRNAWADATNVPRELFADEDDEESDPVTDLFKALRRVVRDEVRAGQA